MTPAFEYGEVISQSWDMVKRNWRPMLKMGLLLFGVQFAGNIVMAGEEPNGIQILLSLSFSLLAGILSLTWIRLALKLVDGKEVESKDYYWMNGTVILNYFVASILYGLIVTAGYILFIIPGIIWSVMFSQYQMAVIDKNLGPIEALKESKRITKGNKWRLVVLGLIEFLFILGGILCLLVGLVVAIPVVVMASYIAYRKLTQAAVGEPVLPSGAAGTLNATATTG